MGNRAGELQEWGPEFCCQPHKSLAKSQPALGRQRQVDPWVSLAIRPTYPTWIVSGWWKTVSDKKGGWCLRKGTQSCSMVCAYTWMDRDRRGDRHTDDELCRKDFMNSCGASEHLLLNNRMLLPAEFYWFIFAMLRVKPRYARQERNCWVPYLYFLFYFRVLG